MIIISLLCAPVSWMDDGLTPSWVVYPIALLIALWRFRSGRGALFVAIAALVFLIIHLPWSLGRDNRCREQPAGPRVSVQPRPMARHAVHRAAGDQRGWMGHVVQATISNSRTG
jgi:hypothetical protein